jgi:hypothetical protein
MPIVSAQGLLNDLSCMRIAHADRKPCWTPVAPKKPWQNAGRVPGFEVRTLAGSGPNGRRERSAGCPKTRCCQRVWKLGDRSPRRVERALSAPAADAERAIHSMRSPRPRQNHPPELKFRSEFRSSGEEYAASFTPQSVQRRSRADTEAGTDRQPPSDTVDTRLLYLPVRRYRLSRRSPVE